MEWIKTDAGYATTAGHGLYEVRRTPGRRYELWFAQYVLTNHGDMVLEPRQLGGKGVTLVQAKEWAESFETELVRADAAQAMEEAEADRAVMVPPGTPEFGMHEAVGDTTPVPVDPIIPPVPERVLEDDGCPHDEPGAPVIIPGVAPAVPGDRTFITQPTPDEETPLESEGKEWADPTLGSSTTVTTPVPVPEDITFRRRQDAVWAAFNADLAATEKRVTEAGGVEVSRIHDSVTYDMPKARTRTTPPPTRTKTGWTPRARLMHINGHARPLPVRPDGKPVLSFLSN